jgi:hypothetical protein
VGFPIRRFLAKDKGKIHLIELMNEGEKMFWWVWKGASKLLKMWLMSWPKLNNRWKTLLILTQMSKGLRKWWKPQNRRKRVKGRGLDSKTFQCLEILVFIWWWRMWDHKK